MPGSPASSWATYRARLKAVFDGADPRVLAAFWLFGRHATRSFRTTDDEGSTNAVFVSFGPAKLHRAELQYTDAPSTKAMRSHAGQRV